MKMCASRFALPLSKKSKPRRKARTKSSMPGGYKNTSFVSPHFSSLVNSSAIRLRSPRRAISVFFPIVLSTPAGFLFRQRKQKIHQIVEFGRREFRSVIGRHWRLFAIGQACERRFVQKMERAVGRQQLKRKIIFIVCDSFQCAAGGESRRNRSMTRVKITVGRDDCIANRFRRPAT